MRRTIGALCVLIVGLQVLIGVPVLVCLVFFVLLHGGMPVAVEVHAGHDALSPALIPPPIVPHPVVVTSHDVQPPKNQIPLAAHLPTDNPILTSRSIQGSPIAGTVLSENVPAETEQRLFVAALEKVVAERAAESPAVAVDLPPNRMPAHSPKRDSSTLARSEEADRSAIQHLYAMADMDEEAGNYDRADQWRALAREIRTMAQRQTAEISAATAEPLCDAADNADSSAK